MINTAELDTPLHSIGFLLEVISPALVSGRFRVTGAHCQPWGVLHGGISALVAEALGSMGAHVASGFRRVAGIQLCVNHIGAAEVDDEIIAEATPLSVGKTMQVWDVQLWKVDPSTSGKAAQIASSKLTLLCNLPMPPEGSAGVALKKYAKL